MSRPNHDVSDDGPLPTVLYGDRRTMTLPKGWEPVEDSMFATALAQTQAAFLGDADDIGYAVKHLIDYYDPAGKYAGATFLDVEGYDDYAITAADLWAVTTLSMDVPPNAGRALMNPGPLRTIVNGRLRHLPSTLPLSDVEARHLDHMWDLYSAIKTMLPALGERDTNQWVMASKICARKRPMLFPVRDSKVCTYLANQPRMGDKPGRLGSSDATSKSLLTSPPIPRSAAGSTKPATKCSDNTRHGSLTGRTCVSSTSCSGCKPPAPDRRAGPHPTDAGTGMRRAKSSGYRRGVPRLWCEVRSPSRTPPPEELR